MAAPPTRGDSTRAASAAVGAYGPWRLRCGAACTFARTRAATLRRQKPRGEPAAKARPFGDRGHRYRAGVGDFDGDGYRDDIAWHQGSTIYTFSNEGLPTMGTVTGIGTPTWAGVGDYNHDGKDDLIWYYGGDGTLHTGASTGTTFTNWTMRRGPGIGQPAWAGTGTFH